MGGGSDESDSYSSPAATKLRTEGLRETLHIVRKNIILERWAFLNRRFDARHHVDTGGSIQPVEVDIASDNMRFGTRHEPTPVKTFRSTMSNLPADLRGFVFVDFGSGKGRALLLASEYDFKRIAGVEHAKDRHLIAQRNIRSYRNRTQRCVDISSLHCDAAAFAILEDPCVLYFYQPFTLDVMTRGPATSETPMWHIPGRSISCSCTRTRRPSRPWNAISPLRRGFKRIRFLETPP